MLLRTPRLAARPGSTARAARHWGRLALMAAVAVLFLGPFYWALVLSVATRATVFTVPPSLIPQWDFASWVRVFGIAPWGLYFLHSVIITGGTILVVLATGALAGYALAEVPFRGREAVLALLLAGLMVPPEAILIPNYVIAYHLHLLNTLAGQVIPFGANVLAVFLFRQFFKTLPVSLWEACRMDGARWWQYLAHVAIPLARPVVMTVTLLTFVAQWSQFQWPLIITQGNAARPVEVALSYLQGFDGSHWRQLAAASLLTLAPIFLVFLFTQRHLIASVAGHAHD